MDCKTDGQGRGVSRERTPRETPQGAVGRSRALLTLRAPVLMVLNEVDEARLLYAPLPAASASQPQFQVNVLL